MTARSIRAGRDASHADKAGAGFALADLLCLAAMPTFAVLAVLSALGRGPVEGICLPGSGGALSGMAFMYTIMSAFHSPPWLRWASAYPILAARALNFETVPIAGECASGTASGSGLAGDRSE